jgi:salicylate hydroxylase
MFILRNRTSRRYDALCAFSINSRASASAISGPLDAVKVNANAWISNFALRFFRFNGARKDYIRRQRELYKIKYSTAMPVEVSQALENRIQRDIFSAANASSNKIKILSFSSNGDNVIDIDNTNTSTSTVISTKDVFNITSIQYLDSSSSPLERYPYAQKEEKNEEGGAIEKRKSDVKYDVAVLSQVLSHSNSSTSEKRIEIIQNVRKLLTDPASDTDMHPHYSGLLLISEKGNIFQHHDPDTRAKNLNDWKATIRSCGFELVKHSHLFSHDDSQRAHCFAFRTTSIPRNTKSSGSGTMSIMQDFERNIDATGTTGSVDGNGNDTDTDDDKSNKTTAANINIKYPIGIIGGGLGGCALAVAFLHKGIDFNIYEKDISFDSRKQGYALTMQQAVNILGTYDITLSKLLEKGTGVASYEHRSYDKDGQELGKYGIGAPSGPGPSYDIDNDSINIASLKNKNKSRHNVHIPRQRVRQLLAERIPQEMVRWNKELLHFSHQNEHEHEHIEATFTDGTTAKFSALIGADGIYSKVRTSLNLNMNIESNYNDDLQYLDVMVILGIAKSTSDQDHKQTQWLDGDTRVFSMPFGDGENVMWQMSFNIDEFTAKNMSKKQELLLETALKRCYNWHQPLVDMLKRTESINVTGHPVYDRNPMQSNLMMNCGLVTLLGDACHPMSPFKGQGANQAIVDAQSLAHELANSHILALKRRNINKALRAYELEMSSRTRSKVLKSRSASIFLHSNAALSKGNITRAMAAEISSYKVS